MGCGASLAGEGGAGLPRGPPPAGGPPTGLAAWSTADVAAWFATLPASLQTYSAQLTEYTNGALLARWDDGLLADAGEGNAYHRSQLLVARDQAAASPSGALPPAPAALRPAPAALKPAPAAPPAPSAPAVLVPAAAPAPAVPAPADKKAEAVAAAKKGVHVLKVALERLGPMLPWPGASGRSSRRHRNWATRILVHYRAFSLLCLLFCA
jgi:hypothetical protein